ncbi:MAG: sterol carrier family protein [Bifidobacteriaceae bacterium]|nr:sterol carrier family protein [Bifidobacteriaceae bacterium]
MSHRRRIPPDEGRRALDRWLAEGSSLGRAETATAVRFTLDELATALPGNSVEVRVPPFGAVSCMPGPRHTRGTPPAVVEAPPQVWLALATGSLPWHDAVRSAQVHASGRRADLAAALPLRLSAAGAAGG